MITADLLIAQNACYPEERLRLLFPQPRTYREVLTLSEGPWAEVPFLDRVFALVCDRTLPREVQLEALARAVARGLNRAGLKDKTAWEVVDALRVGYVSQELRKRVWDATWEDQTNLRIGVYWAAAQDLYGACESLAFSPYPEVTEAEYQAQLRDLLELLP